MLLVVILLALLDDFGTLVGSVVVVGEAVGIIDVCGTLHINVGARDVGSAGGAVALLVLVKLLILLVVVVVLELLTLMMVVMVPLAFLVLVNF